METDFFQVNDSKEQWPHKKLTQTFLWVSRSLWQRRRFPVACCRVGDTKYSSMCTGPFGGGHCYLHYLHHILVSDQTMGKEHSPTHQQKIGLKTYWAWPCPSEQDPVSPSVRLSHQEASIRLLSLSEGRQDEHHNHRKLIKLITWTTALSNSMKLWAMSCRATQDGWVIVESSDKTWSTEGENGKPLQHFTARTPWTVWKGKKIWHWKMNSPGW